eukprot:COSAG02_NODE_9286_length_2266_cov_2.302261_3_plen_38_part_01
MRMRLAAGGEEGAFVEYMDRLTVTRPRRVLEPGDGRPL